MPTKQHKGGVIRGLVPFLNETNITNCFNRMIFFGFLAGCCPFMYESPQCPIENVGWKSDGEFHLFNPCRIMLALIQPTNHPYYGLKFIGCADDEAFYLSNDALQALSRLKFNYVCHGSCF